MRLATSNDCRLSSLLGDRDKWSEIVYGEENNNKNNILYWADGRLEQPRQDKNLFYRHHEPK